MKLILIIWNCSRHTHCPVFQFSPMADWARVMEKGFKGNAENLFTISIPPPTAATLQL